MLTRNLNNAREAWKSGDFEFSKSAHDKPAVETHISHGEYL